MTGNAEHFRWADRPCEHLRGGVTRRYVTSDRVMIGEVTFQAGDTVPPHAHDSEQFTHVVRGALRFRLGTDGREEVLVRTGEVILVPSGVLHSIGQQVPSALWRRAGSRAGTGQLRRS